MRNLRRSVPMALAVGCGLLTLLGLMFIPELGDALTTWASFLVAMALLVGVVNLLSVHMRRLLKGNAYSGLLVISILAIFALALTDFFELTTGGVSTAFGLVQAPLEAAMASLLVFFLLFAGFRLFRRQRNGWSVLFIVTATVILLGSTLLPEALSGIFGQASRFLSDVFVGGGMRGLLIGIAIGTIAVALRVLTGSARPYDK
jgi:hypothetical protein